MRLPDPIANTTTEAYLAYKAGVLAVGDLKPKLYEPYIHLDAWLAYWTGLTKEYPIKNVGKNLFNIGTSLSDWFQTYHDGVDINSYTINRTTATIENNKLVINSYDNTGWTWISRWVSLKKNTEYVISGKNTQAIKIVGLNSKEESARGALIKLKNKAPDGGTTTFNTGDYNYYAISFYPGGADDYFEDIQIEKGSAATAYEPYTGEPEMLTDEEAYIAYLSGVTDTYPEEFKDPADIRVAAYLRYLISARWGRPEYPVTNEEFYLSLQKPPYIPSGDPSSDIEIDGTAKAPFGDVKMYGDTYQQTYTGQNLYNVAQVSSGTYVTKDNDGWITITRDNTSGDTTVYTNVWTSNLALETSTQYKIFIEVKAVSGTGSLFITSTNSTQGQFSSWQEKKLANMAAGQTYTVAPTTKSSFSGISQGLRTVLEQTAGQGGSVTFRLSVCASSTPTETFSYEPYTGGQASPNPEYPQLVRTVTGRQTINVHSANLFNNEPRPSNTSTTTDQITTAKADRTNWWNLEYGADKLNLEYGKTYTAKVHILENAAGFEGQVDIWLDTSGQSVAQDIRLLHSNGYTTTFTYNVINPLRTIRIAFGANSRGVDMKFCVQIEEGSEATDFQLYSSNDYEINLGKNLFNEADALQRGYINETGGITSSNLSVAYTEYYPVEPESTYTISYNVIKAGSSVRYVGFYDSSFSFVSRTNPETSEFSTFTFSTPANARYLRVSFRNSNGMETATFLTDYINNIQIEAGSQATSYAQYFEPIELCKLGDYQDYIYENEGKWYVHKTIFKHLFDGSETWNGGGAGTVATDYTYVYSNSYDTVLKNGVKPYCDKMVGRTGTIGRGDTIDYDTFGIDDRAGNDLIRAFVLTSRLTGSTTTAFKSWLSSNPLTVYAALKDPTDTEITNQALIDQLEALVSGGAENGTTFIKVDATDPNLPGLLYVEAPKYD